MKYIITIWLFEKICEVFSHICIILYIPSFTIQKHKHMHVFSLILLCVRDLLCVFFVCESKREMICIVSAISLNHIYVCYDVKGSLISVHNPLSQFKKHKHMHVFTTNLNSNLTFFLLLFWVLIY